MENYKKIFKNKKVIITGHTGFKGSWLSLWLLTLGAKVIGISNGYTSKPSHFEKLKIKNKIKNYKIDIRNLKKINKVINLTKPDFIFHLAAQSIVKKSFLNPIYNWETNTMGTINVLESIRGLKNQCNVVIITSDKSYKNLELKRGYKEIDDLGGLDPYSASKGSAEFAIQSYVNCFFSNSRGKVKIAVARAGNVVGGGDWSDGRLIPDCIKFWSKNKIVKIRNPNSTRPWQHVLDVLNGYLILAANLKKKNYLHGSVFNFGPPNSNNFSVISVVKKMNEFWPNVKWKIIRKKFFLEHNLLKLNSSKAKKILKWHNIINFNNTIKLIAEWYKGFYLNSKSTFDISVKQIKLFEKIKNKK